ncbi:F0F1 ATP synthase subunit A [Schlesneria sp. T3-172]|uniref:F0F1 ATP synthase subunit A n=1 Tax=Schlesneria sphaerica TaxID=3373610 RepID=UPI0037CA79A4
MDPFHHVRDGQVWELPRFVLDLLGRGEHLVLPGRWTKYMVLQIVAAVLVFLVFRGLAGRVKNGTPVKGGFWNFWEMLALYVRDEIVRPSIGYPHDDHHDDHGNADHAHADHGNSHSSHGSPAVVLSQSHSGADAVLAGGHVALTPSGYAAVDVSHPADKFLPYVWSVFFYILFCNLLGAIPLLGSPTADINVTGMLAAVTFLHVVFFGSQKSGFGGFLKSLVPHMDLPGPIAIILLPLIWIIEAGGLLIKHGVLAVRLFANIMAGHTVLGVFLGFIAVVDGFLWNLVTPASILAQVGVGLLELFVAFLQAYVFALLTSLFISAAVNPH